MSFNTISEWLSLNSNLLLGATWETLYMVAVAGIVGFAVGIPLGVILHTTKKVACWKTPNLIVCLAPSLTSVARFLS